MAKIWSLIFAVILIDIIAFSCILPLLPSIFEYYQNNDGKTGLYNRIINYLYESLNINYKSNTKATSVLFGGFFGSLFSLLQFVSAPTCGHLSDLYGRRPILLINMFGTLLSYVLWFYATNFKIFAFSRIIGGLSKSNISLLTTIATDCSDVDGRGKIMALIGAAFSIGFIIGPFFGGFMARRHIKQSLTSNLYGNANINNPFRHVAFFAIALAAINMILVYIGLPETCRQRLRKKPDKNNFAHNGHHGDAKHSKYPYESDATVLDYVNPISLFNFRPCKRINQSDKRGLKVLGATYFSYLFLFSGLEFTLTFFTHSRFAYTSMDQGKMFCFIGLIMVVLQGGFVRKIRKEQQQIVSLIALILIVPSNIIIAVSYNKALFYTGLFIYSLSTSMAVPTLTSMVSFYGHSDEKGVIMGIHRSLGALARACGPLLFSILFWQFGATKCYMYGAFLQIIPALFFYKFYYCKMAQSNLKSPGGIKLD